MTTQPPAKDLPESPPLSLADHLLGVALFLFIPLVLFLFVGHPEPIGASLAGGVVLMLGHRLLARPFMRRVAPRRCLWSGGGLQGHAAETLELGGQAARVRADHGRDLRRFFTFLQRYRILLRLGIFVPLVLFLLALLGAALGLLDAARLAVATDAFRLVIGLTVNAAAWGWLFLDPPDDHFEVPFPVHNFFLLGVRALLWVFRLMGLWWIAAGALGLARLVG
ncbi:MAG: hypothetical protein AAGC60_25785 [Acidobacteriota bacterium]